MNNRLKNYGLLILVFVAWITLNYNPQPFFKLTSRHWGWIFSACAFILIIQLMRWRNPNDWKLRLGINFKRDDVLKFLSLTVLFLLPLYFLIDHLTLYSGYTFEVLIFHYKKYFGPDCAFHVVIGFYLYYLFQTLNEEMLIGAILLLGLERRFKNLDQNYINILVALTFSLMHQVLFQLSPGQPGILLKFTTMGSLFFVGILRNVLILKTRKIALSWAVHLSFNLIFYASAIVEPNTKIFASETERFNIVFGNYIFFFLAGIFAGASLIIAARNKRRPGLI